MPEISPSDACARLHSLISKLPLLQFSDSLDAITGGWGLYFFSERTGLDWERSGHGDASSGITRIGISSTTSSRIEHHFDGAIPLAEISVETFCPKDRSIFRKHIGRALLNSPGHPHGAYLSVWDVDLTTKKARESQRSSRRIDVERAIEGEVSDILKSRFSFRSFKVPNGDVARQIESACVGIVSACPACRRSVGWLGRHHPRPGIANGKLWNVQGVSPGYRGPYPFDIMASLI